MLCWCMWRVVQYVSCAIPTGALHCVSICLAQACSGMQHRAGKPGDTANQCDCQHSSQKGGPDIGVRQAS